MRPWYRRYHTKFPIRMFVFAFLGNYFSESFCEILHMQFRPPSMLDRRWSRAEVQRFRASATSLLRVLA